MIIMKSIVSLPNLADVNTDILLTDVSYDETREYGFFAHIDPSRINVPRLVLPIILHLFNILMLWTAIRIFSESSYGCSS
jgi:hypothetical protein